MDQPASHRWADHQFLQTSQLADVLAGLLIELNAASTHMVEFAFSDKIKH